MPAGCHDRSKQYMTNFEPGTSCENLNVYENDKCLADVSIDNSVSLESMSLGTPGSGNCIKTKTQSNKIVHNYVAKKQIKCNRCDEGPKKYTPYHDHKSKCKKKNLKNKSSRLENSDKSTKEYRKLYKKDSGNIREIYDRTFHRTEPGPSQYRTSGSPNGTEDRKGISNNRLDLSYLKKLPIPDITEKSKKNTKESQSNDNTRYVVCDDRTCGNVCNFRDRPNRSFHKKKQDNFRMDTIESICEDEEIELNIVRLDETRDKNLKLKCICKKVDDLKGTNKICNPKRKRCKSAKSVDNVKGIRHNYECLNCTAENMEGSNRNKSAQRESYIDANLYNVDHVNYDIDFTEHETDRNNNYPCKCNTDFGSKDRRQRNKGKDGELAVKKSGAVCKISVIIKPYSQHSASSQDTAKSGKHKNSETNQDVSFKNNTTRRNSKNLERAFDDKIKKCSCWKYKHNYGDENDGGYIPPTKDTPSYEDILITENKNSKFDENCRKCREERSKLESKYQDGWSLPKDVTDDRVYSHYYNDDIKKYGYPDFQELPACSRYYEPTDAYGPPKSNRYESRINGERLNDVCTGSKLEDSMYGNFHDKEPYDIEVIKAFSTRKMSKFGKSESYVNSICNIEPTGEQRCCRRTPKLNDEFTENTDVYQFNKRYSSIDTSDSPLLEEDSQASLAVQDDESVTLASDLNSHDLIGVICAFCSKRKMANTPVHDYLIQKLKTPLQKEANSPPPKNDTAKGKRQKKTMSPYMQYRPDSYALRHQRMRSAPCRSSKSPAKLRKQC